MATVVYFTEQNSLAALFDFESQLQDSTFLKFFAQEAVSADLDSAQRFLLQNLWYNGSLLKTGNVRGMPAVPMEEPRVGFGGVAYFTDGNRIVALLSEEPVALDETEFIYDIEMRGTEAEDQQ